jgi:glucan 1,3-beta-glucosidase
VRNFVIDVRQMPASTSATGLHWQVAQATSLINIVVEMSTAIGNNHQGKVRKNHAGPRMLMCPRRYLHGKRQRWIHGRLVTRAGSVSTFCLITILDIVFNGGKFGIWVGNQQCVGFVF